MEIKIRFFTTLREIAKTREETLSFPKNKKATVSMALQALSKKYGKAFDEYVFDSETGGIKGFLQLLVNGINISTLDVELKDGDVLAILPPVSGG